jgi:hypothetical protein
MPYKATIISKKVQILKHKYLLQGHNGRRYIKFNYKYYRMKVPQKKSKHTKLCGKLQIKYYLIKI